MIRYYKYPKTPHLPNSLSVSRDDNRLESVTHFLNKEVIITEKRDGENTSMYSDHFHARSIDSKHHPSRNYVKQLWGSICRDIPENHRICGENLYAKHSIEYSSLQSYFEVFSIWNDLICLSWNETVEWCDLLGLEMVPVLYRGLFNDLILEKIISEINLETQEGFVVRLADSFEYKNFDKSIAKWVRSNHVQTDEHWMHGKITPNKLK